MAIRGMLPLFKLLFITKALEKVTTLLKFQLEKLKII